MEGQKRISTNRISLKVRMEIVLVPKGKLFDKWKSENIPHSYGVKCVLKSCSNVHSEGGLCPLGIWLMLSALILTKF